jgi:hypothetical protein
MFRISATAIQARVDFCAPSLMASALQLIFCSAEDKVSFVIDEHDLAVYMKLQQSSLNLTYSHSTFIAFADKSAQYSQVLQTSQSHSTTHQLQTTTKWSDFLSSRLSSPPSLLSLLTDSANASSRMAPTAALL